MHVFIMMAWWASFVLLLHTYLGSSYWSEQNCTKCREMRFHLPAAVVTTANIINIIIIIITWYCSLFLSM